MSKGITIRMRRRALIVAIMISIVCFVSLAFRLVVLQIFQSSYLGNMATEQQLVDAKLNARRGTIYDRNMIPIAQSSTVWNVILEPNYIKDEKIRELICTGLSEILEIKKSKIEKLVSKRSFYIIAKKKVNNEIKDRILNFKTQNNISNGIRLIEDYKRHYPFGHCASSVLGFTGEDSQGLAGIESYYEKWLAGQPGKLISAKNAIGTDMPYDYEQMIPAKNGYSLRLCIDSSLQRILEKYLEDGVKLNKVQNRASAITMNVNTGEILAMAVKEDFDPNDPFKIISETDISYLESLPENERSKARGEILLKQWRNKAISDVYYPGSVFKIVTAAMGLELNKVNENSVFSCTGGIKISERSQYIRCHKHGGHGTQNFVEAFCHSCNPAFITLGQRIGTEDFFNYYKAFGFHEKTGIDLPGETRDLFFNENGKMAPIDLAVASMGQNFGITSIQMLTAAAVIANGGKLVRPHVVKEILDKDGNIVKSFGTEVRRKVISEDTAKRVSAMMARNACEGGGINGNIVGMRIAAKTGTSEKIGLSSPGKKDYISSFCGFSPAENPEIVTIVFLDTPRGQFYYGSIVAAPIFAAFMREALPICGIEPKYTSEELKKYAKVPELVGKKKEIARNQAIFAGFRPIIVGDGEVITSQIPNINEQIPKGGSIVIYAQNEAKFESVKVPNFVGYRIGDAKEIANSININLIISGFNENSGIIAIQNPVPGSSVSRGSTISVVARKNAMSD
ncbi:MAG: PASTA domain-containing protein [Oscillospiraceae bacterium]|jgi:stage V sporulation protein D (sporulation-specific penicillin-binding protein)|nr:PASTA domain-containing protein [Oscillospiraceae bacterium]